MNGKKRNTEVIALSILLAGTFYLLSMESGERESYSHSYSAVRPLSVLIVEKMVSLKPSDLCEQMSNSFGSMPQAADILVGSFEHFFRNKVNSLEQDFDEIRKLYQVVCNKDLPRSLQHKVRGRNIFQVLYTIALKQYTKGNKTGAEELVKKMEHSSLFFKHHATSTFSYKYEQSNHLGNYTKSYTPDSSHQEAHAILSKAIMERSLQWKNFIEWARQAYISLEKSARLHQDDSAMHILQKGFADKKYNLETMLYGQGALNCFIVLGENYQNTSLIEIILNHFVSDQSDVNHLVNSPDCYGHTPLANVFRVLSKICSLRGESYWAQQNFPRLQTFSLRLANILFAHGADVTLCSPSDKTILFKAAVCGSKECLEFILNKLKEQLEPNQFLAFINKHSDKLLFHHGEMYRTALGKAACYQDKESFELLLQYGAWDSETLCEACARGDMYVFEQMLTHMPEDVSKRKIFNYALAEAVLHLDKASNNDNLITVIKKLLTEKVLLSSCLTLAKIARKEGFNEIADLLEEHHLSVLHQKNDS